MAQLRFPVTRAGLAVPVWIGQHRVLTAALLASGKPPVLPVQARGLLDTATDLSAVAAGVLQQLAISPVSSTAIHTAGGSVTVRLFRVSLGITDPSQPAGAPWLTEPDLLVTELPAPLPDADVLVGLDVLLDCKLVLDGPGRSFTLEF
jgi:hypothetical protein